MFYWTLGQNPSSHGIVQLYGLGILVSMYRYTSIVALDNTVRHRLLRQGAAVACVHCGSDQAVRIYTRRSYHTIRDVASMGRCMDVPRARKASVPSICVAVQVRVRRFTVRCEP
jgi:hypothetical protein